MKRYICGLCRKRKQAKEFVSTRQGLRKHLREEHFIMKDIANSSMDRHSKEKDVKDFWIAEEI